MKGEKEKKVHNYSSQKYYCNTNTRENIKNDADNVNKRRKCGLCDFVSVGGWLQLSVCLCGTMFVLWGYADRWLGHLHVCGRTVPPLSASQREWIAEAARHTVVSVNLAS